jgi:hypothetical protein
MNDERLTDELARAMGWRPGPDRFVKSGRSWISKWRFRPLADLSDAFQLLDHVTDHYTLSRDGGTFTAQVRAGSGRGTASGELMARTITVAVARAMGLDPADGTTPASITTGTRQKDEARKR